jgi:hypothetical protein
MEEFDVTVKHVFEPVDGVEQPKKKGKGVSIMSQEDTWKVYETNSPLYNLLWSCCIL